MIQWTIWITIKYNKQEDTMYNTNNMIQYTMEYNVQWEQIWYNVIQYTISTIWYNGQYE